MTVDRYEGKPLKRLLECYVLSAIGELSPNTAERLMQMTPKLREIYGVDGAWDEILAAVMHFPSGFATEVARLWQKNQQIARQANATLSPRQFAEMFVDANFGDN